MLVVSRVSFSKSKTMSSFLVDSVEGRRYSNQKSLRVSRAHCQRAVGVARNKLPENLQFNDIRRSSFCKQPVMREI